jgi:class 3 adenylate cyclase
MEYSDINLTVQGAPWGWVVAAVLLFLLMLAVAIIFVLFKKAIGGESGLDSETKRSLETTYAAKVREEFIKKHQGLAKKVDEVRSRFAMVISKVRTLLDTLDPDELFNVICDILAKEVGAGRYIIFLYDEVKNELYPFKWQGYTDEIKNRLLISADAPHILNYAVNRKQIIIRNDDSNDSRVQEIMNNAPQLDTLVAIPLVSKTRAYGVIHLHSFEDGHVDIDANEARFLAALPTFVGGALENANVFVQTREELTSAVKVTQREIEEKQRIQELFSKYTSPELIETLLKNPEKINLGGENKEASILFADVVGFTAMSSKLKPEETVMYMNEFFTRMTDVIFDYQGEVDKFIGDAIMVRFGVLTEMPYPGKTAVECADAMLREIDKLRVEWSLRGIEEFNVRLGIASGQVLAGNIGSKRRQEFTVMGTVVNLASRLENLNKERNCRLIIDENTHSQLPPGQYIFDKQADVQVRGLDEPINIYEYVKKA